MNCPNCGAPMRLILEKRQFVCNHCTTSHFPEENRDGVRVLGGLSQGLCPNCKVHHLLFATVADKTILHCKECRGLLLQIHELMPTIRALRAQRPVNAEVIPPPVDRSELKRKINCPVCRKTMDTYLYGDGGNVHVDSCVECGVIWLDHGELKRIVDAPTRQKREVYKTSWEQEPIRRCNDSVDLWSGPSVLTSNIGGILDLLF